MIINMKWPEIESWRREMTDRASVNNGGIGFAGLLTICFIVLKLTGVIKWSWIWVLSPIWISAIMTIGIIGIMFVLYLLFNDRGW